MNRAGGYISLHRQLLDWEWYMDINTCRLFVHLLLTVNFADTRYQGIEVRRGQIMTSLSSLSKQTGLTVQEVKTALNHLISTNEITNESNHQYRIITVVKYDEYQNATNEITNDQQTTNKRSTNDQQCNNKNNKNNKINKKNNSSEFTPPTVDEVQAYIEEKGYDIDAQYFVDYYEGNGWVRGNGQKIMNWKAVVNTWQRREKDGVNGQYSGPRVAEEPRRKSELYDTVIRLG